MGKKTDTTKLRESTYPSTRSPTSFAELAGPVAAAHTLVEAESVAYANQSSPDFSLDPTPHLMEM